jgi:type IV pilus assembly protein PilA
MRTVSRSGARCSEMGTIRAQVVGAPLKIQQGKLQKGFSLIELLIVVSVILVIAGISIPTFLQSRMRANETSAVTTLRQMATASLAYQVECDNGFESSLLLLGPGGGDCTSGANLLDSILGGSASPQKSGYVFVFTGDGQTPSNAYAITADPLSSYSGTRHFYIDQTGVVRENDTTTAGAADLPIQ